MITWPIAIVMIGGIASICLTILKIVSMRKQNKNNCEQGKETCKTLIDVKERLIVIETKFEDHIKVEEGNSIEVKGQISKLTDIIMEVLKKIKLNGH